MQHGRDLVLKQNDYSLEEGTNVKLGTIASSQGISRRQRKKSVFALPVRCFSWPGRGVACRFRHLEKCGQCGERGEEDLLLCSHCPFVYELRLGRVASPHLRSLALRSYHASCLNRHTGGTFICPQHKCGECFRSPGDAGGVLYRCSESSALLLPHGKVPFCGSSCAAGCAWSFCEDHAPSTMCVHQR